MHVFPRHGPSADANHFAVSINPQPRLLPQQSNLNPISTIPHYPLSNKPSQSPSAAPEPNRVKPAPPMKQAPKRCGRPSAKPRAPSASPAPREIDLAPRSLKHAFTFAFAPTDKRFANSNPRAGISQLKIDRAHMYTNQLPS